MRYFIAGNFWLFVALIMLLCARLERSNPDYVSFLGMGNEFSAEAYIFVTILVFVVGCVFFVMARKVDRKK